MPYFAKSVFLTVSYFVLMSGIADLKMFFVSLLIFAGGILFDLYFSHKSLSDMGEDLAVSITAIIIYILAVVAILGLLVSILGMCDIFWVTKIDGIKYIAFKNDELKNAPSILQTLKFKFSNFLTILFIEIASCLPDFLIHKMDVKAKIKKKS